MIIQEIDKKESKRSLFHRILDNSDFYSTEDLCDKAFKYYEQRLKDARLSIDETLQIDLAITWIKLHKGNLSGLKAKMILQELSSRIDKIGKFNAELQIVKSKILLMEGNHRGAKELLEALVHRQEYQKDPRLYALIARTIAAIYMMLGEVNKAEEYSQDCISLSRKLNDNLSLGHCLNNYGILKKKVCQYEESERILKDAMKIFKHSKALEGEALCCGNIGIVKMKLGDWKGSEYYFKKANALMKEIYSSGPKVDFNNINIAKLKIMRRDYDDAKILIFRLMQGFHEGDMSKHKALLLEYLGQLYREVGDIKGAMKNFRSARDIIKKCAPNSDVMTEIIRCETELMLKCGKHQEAMMNIKDCIHRCVRIGDKYELGAALRVLGQIHAARGYSRKAISAFDTGINILKGINECYELMKTCALYAEYLINECEREAECYLLQALQLSRKLDSNYFMCKIILLLGKSKMKIRDYSCARIRLREAGRLSDKLNSYDKKILSKELMDLDVKLKYSMMKDSMDSAQRLRVLGKIYEEARFPIEEAKQELAFEVARNVGADSLFVVKGIDKRYSILLAYNISSVEAKKISKVVYFGKSKKEFKVRHEPRIQDIGNGEIVICIPSKKNIGCALFAIIKNGQCISTKQLEFLFASLEAIERIAKDYHRIAPVIRKDEFLGENVKHLSHPGKAFGKIKTIDPEMIRIIHLAERASKTDVPILLEGETGVGKELFARAIHESSPRKKNIFIALNAGGLAVNFLESQLFGHVKGSFTDAIHNREGLIEEASGGSIFFDEIGEMSDEMQVKLLRLLENREYRRLGDNQLRLADIRVISATNKNLEDLIRKGRFRKDLYYRIAMLKFSIPSLRFRKRDVELLVQHFLKSCSADMGCSKRQLEIDAKALEALELYDWPGNVREVQNEIMRIISLIGDNELIDFSMLSDSIKGYFSSHIDEGMLERSIERYERKLILKALEENEWNRIKTAEQIGIPRTTLIGKMKRLKIIL